MLIKDVMNEVSVVCTEEMPLTKVFRLMLENDCGCIPVVESYAHPVPIGSISEKDICLQIVGKNRDPQRLTAANVMNGNICKAKNTATVFDCLNLMQNREADRLFVLDAKGAICGTIKRTELEAVRSRQHIDDLYNQVSADAPRYSQSRIF